MNKFEILQVNQTHPGLEALISLSIGNPTSNKIKNVLAEYAAKDRFLLGCIADNNLLVGILGIKISASSGEILHIAVLQKHQRTNIGSTLIQQAIEDFNLDSIYAETDHEGIDFYSKYGFSCVPCESKYENRYICRWQAK